MIDDHLPLRFDSALEYIDGHDSLFFKFLRERVKEADQVRAVDELLKEPVVVANLLRNYSLLTEYERVMKAIELISTAGNVTVMIGAKRHGKTATATYIIELLLLMGIKVYWLGYSPAIEKHYPQVMQTFDTKIVKNGILLVDETAVQMDALDFARKDQKQKMKRIWTSGHSDYSTIYISQTFRINIKILNALDVIWFKPFFNMDFDRETAKQQFSDSYEYIKPIHKNENLVIDKQTNNSWFFTNELPSRWCEALSKPFSNISSKEEAMRYFAKLTEAKLSDAEKSVLLDQRGLDMEDLVRDIIGKVETDIKITERETMLKKAGLGHVLRCDVCGSIHITNKDKRKGKQRKMCLDCGRTGYEERFRIPA